MTTPAHEWPTRTTGPSAFRIVRRLAVASFSRDSSGFLEANIFKIRNDFVPGRPVSKRTVDQDYRFGFQFGSPSWLADCAHRTQEGAQANNTFVEFHGYTPWFGGRSVFCPLLLFVRGGLLGVGPAEYYARRGHIDQSLARAGAGMSGAAGPVWTCTGGTHSIGFPGSGEPWWRVAAAFDVQGAALCQLMFENSGCTLKLLGTNCTRDGVSIGRHWASAFALRWRQSQLC